MTALRLLETVNGRKSKWVKGETLQRIHWSLFLATNKGVNVCNVTNVSHVYNYVLNEMPGMRDNNRNGRDKHLEIRNLIICVIRSLN